LKQGSSYASAKRVKWLMTGFLWDGDSSSF